VENLQEHLFFTMRDRKKTVKWDFGLSLGGSRTTAATPKVALTYLIPSGRWLYRNIYSSFLLSIDLYLIFLYMHF
jgi:hypothetical protein